ncbi:MAG: ABC transporter ATP-binding protein [Spirochaetales bacterium]|nr:ABC transporter ATP-binding protein [Spirochaetales bacterium]
MSFIFPYLKKYRLSLILAPLLMMGGVATDLAMPTLMAEMVDQGVKTGDQSLILQSGLKMMILALAGLAAGVLNGRFSARASVGGAAALREDLFRKIQTLSHENLDRLKSSDLISRLTADVTQIERMIQFTLRIVLRAPIKIVGSLIMAVIIGGQLSLILAVVSPIIVLTIALLVHLTYPFYHRVQGNLDLLNRRLQENLSGVRLVKSFCREEEEQEKFRNASRNLAESTAGANRLMALMNPLMQLFMNGSVIVVLWRAGILTGESALPAGKLMAFINYLSQMLFMLIMISNVLIQFSRARVSLDRIREVMDEEGKIQNGPDRFTGSARTGKLIFEEVSFRYDDRAGDVLNRVSFEAEPGQIVAIMGATGSGKSTLAQLIPRFYDVSSGRISLDGRDIREWDVKTLRRKISLLSQRAHLFSGSVEKNILFGTKEGRREEAIRAAEEACAAEFIDNLPEGYETDVRQRGVNFSGGQKQRLSLARALAREPEILILDDTTSAVDLKTEEMMWKNLMKRTDRITLVIAQKISTVKRADRILLLDEGEAVAWGSHEELRASSSLYGEICLSQEETAKERVQ